MTLLLLHIASCQVFGLCTHVWPPVHSNEDGEGTMPLGPDSVGGCCVIKLSSTLQWPLIAPPALSAQIARRLVDIPRIRHRLPAPLAGGGLCPTC